MHFNTAQTVNLIRIGRHLFVSPVYNYVDVETYTSVSGRA